MIALLLAAIIGATLAFGPSVAPLGDTDGGGSPQALLPGLGGSDAAPLPGCPGSHYAPLPVLAALDPSVGREGDIAASWSGEASWYDNGVALRGALMGSSNAMAEHEGE